MTMRVVAVREAGGPEVLEMGERPVPDAGPGQLRIRVAAAGVNRADVLQRRGRYPAPPGVLPDVPGLEYAGVVDAVGAGVDGWREGDRAMGLVAGGAYAETVVVHEREAIPVPDRLSLEDAAAVPEVFITALDALTARLHLGMGERLLIHAVGSGVGTAALQLAVAAGATVYGTARSAWKLERAAALGLPESRAVDASGGDWADALLQRTGGAGVHAVLDLVGGAYLGGNLRVVTSRGRIVIVGLVAGASAELDMGALLRRRATLVGTVLRTRPLEERIEAAHAFRRHVIPLLDAGSVRAIVDRVLPMDAAADAHRAMEADENFGKIVLRW